MSRVIKSDNANKWYKTRKTIQLADMIFEEEEDYPEEGADPVPILKKAEIEAMNIRKKAKEEAEQAHREIEELREQAKKEIEQAAEDARKRGYREGFQAGQGEARKQYESAIEEARRTIDLAKSARRERLDETEFDILELACAIAEKIIGSVLPEEKNRWLDMVQRAVSEVKEHEEIRLTVHHKWYEFMLNHQKELEALLKHSADFYIYPEAAIDEFTCVIEFPFGRVDASVDSQLSEIKQKLSAKLEESNDGRHGFVERN
ncbi:MAG TPA: flagellar assembly protein FliH [Bacillales bacterium]|nr:flagellar assembly protein FliH [Bacillales bacterium]